MIYVGIVLCTCTPLLLLFGARISARIQAAREAADRLAWLADRARTETDMSRRAAWRTLRRVMQEEDEL